MASLTLKNLPDDLLRNLRAAAARERRSLTQQAIHLLAAGVRQPSPVPAADVQAQVAAWRKLAGKWKSDVDEPTESRRITKRRSPGRAVDL